MYRALVTGSAGFIGSNLVDKLLSLGHKVTTIDNESSTSNSQFYWNPQADNYTLDITNFEDINPLFKEVDYVFHMAAESRVQTSIENPELTIATNIIGTNNVLRASKEANVKRVIYSTTSSVYGNSNPTPNTETQSPDCINPYAISKYAGEQLCKMYSSLYKLDTVSLRYFNVYGNREPSHGPYAPVVSKFIDQHKAGKFLTIAGDGEQRRDFINVEDVVLANLAAMTFNESLNGEIFNIGSGKNFSINELAQLISTKYQYLPTRPGEARETLADISKAKTVLGWEPRVDLKNYIKESVS